MIRNLLGSWAHRGNIELYFKHRYRDFNHPIGSLTEYYKFNTEDVKIVLCDLQQMQPKILSLDEIDILEENTRACHQLSQMTEAAR